jgi:hypothetical protein
MGARRVGLAAGRAPPLTTAIEGDRWPNMSGLFISCHGPHREAVNRVHGRLKVQGISSFLDREHLVGPKLEKLS